VSPKSHLIFCPIWQAFLCLHLLWPTVHSSLWRYGHKLWTLLPGLYCNNDLAVLLDLGWEP
jgi:hypothetical protein